MFCNDTVALYNFDFLEKLRKKFVREEEEERGTFFSFSPSLSTSHFFHTPFHTQVSSVEGVSRGTFNVFFQDSNFQTFTIFLRNVCLLCFTLLKFP